MPYMCLWMSRLLSIGIAYYYHGIPAFFVLNWVLFSFGTRVTKFVTFTCAIYLPVLTCFFFFGYLSNIPELFYRGTTIYNEDILYYTPVYRIPPLEIAFQALNVLFMTVMIKTRATLALQRDEFRIAIFRKFSDK
jgi:hypothetical protein